MGPDTAIKWCRLCLAMILVTAGPAHAVKLYKWVDENGSTHYHQEPPPKGAQFVEEKDFDGETNVVPSPETEAEMHGAAGDAPESAGQGPAAGEDGEQQAAEPEQRPLTPEELTAIAQEAEPKPEQPIETPGIGADPAGGGETATGAAAGGSGAGGAGAGTAAGAPTAPVSPISPPVVVPGP